MNLFRVQKYGKNKILLKIKMSRQKDDSKTAINKNN